MGNTYSQIYIQVVFAVKGRLNFIKPEFENDLYKYITGIITESGQKLIAINGMPDHIHIFIGVKPNCRLSDLVREIKKASTQFIRSSKFLNNAFQWQSGFGAFSYSRSHIPNVVHYIESQKEHHKKRSFRSEYLELLEKFEIDFETKYLFEFYSD